MDAVMLSSQNIQMLTDFEKTARATEAEIFIDEFDEESFRAKTLKALGDANFSSARCLMCVVDNRAIGRLDFAILPSFAFGGDLQAYVDWVYVLKEYRHKGVAQFLFKEMANYLRSLGVGNYFLILADNEEAQSFYRSMNGATIEKKEVLTGQL